MRLVTALVAACAFLLSPAASASGGKYASQGEAYAACMADGKNGPSAWQPMRCNESLYNGGGGSYNAWDRSGRDVGWPSYWWSAGTDCKDRPYESGWEGSSTPGIVNVCHNGCLYESSLDPEATSGVGYFPMPKVCTTNDAPEPKPATPGGGDDGGGTGGETGGGDGDGGGDGGGNGDGGGGDGGGNGEGGGNGDGDGGGNSDGGGDGDGDGDGDGENPSLPENPTYPGDVPMPYADPPIPSSYLGQWSSGLGGGSCPAAKVVTIGVGPVSTSVSFEFKPLCDFAQMIRGLVIACAALAAAYIVSGVRK